VMNWPDSKSRYAWWLIAVLFGAIVVWVVFNYVGTFILGLFLYYVTRPAHRRLKNRFRPSIAASISLLAMAVPILLLVAYTLAVAIQELSRLEQTVNLGPLAEQIEPYVDLSEVFQDPQMLLQNPDFVSAGQLIAAGVFDYIPIVGTALINLFLALALAFYLLRDGAELSHWSRDIFSDQRGLLNVYLDFVDEDLGSVFFGNILNAFFIAIVAAFVYTVLNFFAPAQGIPYPALVAVLAGAASLVPVVGMKLVYVPLAIGLFARAILSGEPLWFPTVFVVATVVLIDFIPDLVLRPYVSGRNLHVGLVMIAYIIGPLLFGWYGLFLGPFILVVVYHFVRVVLPVLIDSDSDVPTAESLDSEGAASGPSDDPPGSGQRLERTGTESADGSGTSDDVAGGAEDIDEQSDDVDGGPA